MSDLRDAGQRSPQPVAGRAAGCRGRDDQPASATQGQDPARHPLERPATMSAAPSCTG
jgi:hypothetical protein